jgi:hypothetical protein
MPGDVIFHDNFCRVSVFKSDVGVNLIILQKKEYSADLTKVNRYLGTPQIAENICLTVAGNFF